MKTSMKTAMTTDMMSASRFDAKAAAHSVAMEDLAPEPKPVAGEARCIVCRGITEISGSGLVDTRFGIAGRAEARRCLVCRLEQLFPVPAPAELKDLYERFYNFGGERGTLYTTLRERFLSSWLYRLWILVDGDISFHARTGRGRLLDIGCNEGRTLKNYARNGFWAEGTELNEAAAAVARQAGFTVHTGALADFRPAVPFDIVVLSNVLEHALDPKAMLLSIRRLLRGAGQVWISCPNSRSWLRSVFGGSWINWHVPFHISHFSAQTLGSLLCECGFVVGETRQITPALWVASSIVARLFAREGRPTRELRNPLLMFALVALCRAVLFPLLWLGNVCGRGDCQTVVATVSADRLP